MWRAALLVALAVGLAATASTAAQTGSGTLTIGSGAAAVGEDLVVTLEVHDVPQPGLGAWSVSIHYDPNVVSATVCSANPGEGVCYAGFAPDIARLTGAVSSPIVGNYVLGQLSFRCLAAGNSQLALSEDVFTIAVVPPAVVIPELQNGSITCAAATATPATATPASAALPSTGSGGGSTPSVAWLPIALLASAGAIALVATYRRLRS